MFGLCVDLPQTIIADLQILCAAILFGAGFSSQRQVSLLGMGPMTCNFLRFAISTIFLYMYINRFGKWNIKKSIGPNSPEKNKADQTQAQALALSLQMQQTPHKPLKRFIPSVSSSGRCQSVRDLLYKMDSATYWGIILGAVNFAGSGLQQWGIAGTSAGKVGILAGFDVFLTPVIATFIPSLKKNASPSLSTWAAVVISLLGLFLMSDDGTGNMFIIGWGDTVIIISTFFWALHIAFTDMSTEEVELQEMMFVQFAVVTLLSLACAVCLEFQFSVIPLPVTNSISQTVQGNTTITITKTIVIESPESHSYSYKTLELGMLIVILAVTEGLAFVLMAMGQIYSPPTHVALLVSLEGVFSASFGYIFLGETLSIRELVGCALMIFAMYLAKTGGEGLVCYWKKGLLGGFESIGCCYCYKIIPGEETVTEDTEVGALKEKLSKRKDWLPSLESIKTIVLDLYENISKILREGLYAKKETKVLV